MLKHTEALLQTMLQNKRFTNCAVSVGDKNGCLDRILLDNGCVKTDPLTQFDMASVTKILGVTVPALRLMARGAFDPNACLGAFFPNAPEEKKSIPLWRLWTHSAGFRSWYPIAEEGIPADNDAISANILSQKLISPVGGQTVYSCPSFILLGHILEKLCGKSLAALLQEETVRPLGLQNTAYLPKRASERIVPAAQDGAPAGVVSDGMARFRGGISGNAGVFSCIADMERFCTALANGGAPLIAPELLAQATVNRTPELADDRGWGFQLVTPRYAQTAELFPNGAFGHCGHTGTSFFVDARSGFYAIILTNATLLTGIPEHYDTVMQMRAEIHHAICLDMQKGNTKNA